LCGCGDSSEERQEEDSGKRTVHEKRSDQGQPSLGTGV
jgi:hypothetical protein